MYRAAVAVLGFGLVLAGCAGTPKQQAAVAPAPPPPPPMPEMDAPPWPEPTISRTMPMETAPAGAAEAVSVNPPTPDAGGREGIRLRTGLAAGNTAAPPAPAAKIDYFGPPPPDAPAVTMAGGETYVRIEENRFLPAAQHPYSTFSIDVDTASYSNVRRMLESGQRPAPDAVRIEELINAFDYTLPQPEAGQPFSVRIETTECPWAEGHALARIALQGRTVPMEDRPAANLVFLVDVSGSMDQPKKLPLVKESLKALLRQLGDRDRVAIVTYASGSAVALDSTPCEHRRRIERAIDGLAAAGSTHGSAGIQDAYKVARAHFIEGGINRVFLATDGDFNVGVTDFAGLLALIADEAKSKVFLTTLGFGYGNLKDANLEQLADKGNGNYAYIDDYAQARKVLVEQLGGTMIAIAKDVKIQVEFNPARVQAYRLIGYENRLLEARDFNDDTKDAGEIGAGHRVTALYQIVPIGAAADPGVDPLKYGAPPAAEPAPDASPEWMTVKLRAKPPEGDVSSKVELGWAPPAGAVPPIASASADQRFAASVAAFGMLLRNSPHKGRANFDGVIAMAESAAEGDHDREEFVNLAVTAKTLTSR